MHSCSKLEEKIYVGVDFHLAQILRLCNGRHSIHGPYFIYVHNICVRTQVKMKRQWKYTFSYMNWATTSRTEGVEACIRL